MNKTKILPIFLILSLGLMFSFVSAETCSDTDTGLDYSAKGVLSVGGNTYEDTCTDANFVKEYFCDNPPSYYDNYYCPNGCSNGACIKFEPSEETGPIDLPEDIPEEEIVLLCNGCELEGKCYPFNYRKDKTYCSIDKEFVSQLKPESSCENNFECDSNLCINDKCVSGSLWAKFTRWLSKIFG